MTIGRHHVLDTNRLNNSKYWHQIKVSLKILCLGRKLFNFRWYKRFLCTVAHF